MLGLFTIHCLSGLDVGDSQGFGESSLPSPFAVFRDGPFQGDTETLGDERRPFPAFGPYFQACNPAFLSYIDYAGVP